MRTMAMSKMLLAVAVAIAAMLMMLVQVLPAAAAAAHSPSYRVSSRTNQKIALPTASQLAWMAEEVSMLIHYNIATYLTDATLDGCNSEPHLVPDLSTFQPTLVNTDQWVDVIDSFGARSAVLVVKHNCGMTTWPFNTTFTLASGETVWYNYTIANSDYPTLDLAGSLAKSLRARNLTLGFYASTQWNDYLNVYAGSINSGALQPNQLNVTLETYDAVVLAMIKDLWSHYGNLREVWFDGGYTQAQRDALSTLLAALQPNAVAFNAFVADNYTNPLTFNAAKWIGTEYGNAPYPTWSAGTCAQGSGDPTEPYFCPANCDTTLQADDTWFWRPNHDLRPLTELIGVFHTTVGRNCKLEMDLTPDVTGLIPATYAARYAQVGQFVSACYGQPVAVPSSTRVVYGANAKYSGRSSWESPGSMHPLQAVLAADADVPARYVIEFTRPVAVDRVMLVEDQSNGQLITQYTLEAMVVDTAESAASRMMREAVPWTLMSNGTSIGFKRIDLWTAPVLVTAVRLTIVDAMDENPIVSTFSVHLCDELERAAAELDARERAERERERAEGGVEIAVIA